MWRFTRRLDRRAVGVAAARPVELSIGRDRLQVHRVGELPVGGHSDTWHLEIGEADARTVAVVDVRRQEARVERQAIVVRIRVGVHTPWRRAYSGARGAGARSSG